jgi:hypothetical protein
MASVKTLVFIFVIVGAVFAQSDAYFSSSEYQKQKGSDKLR